MFKFISYSYN